VGLEGALSGVRLRYADGWPELQDASGTLSMAGGRLKAAIQRTQLAGAQVEGARMELALEADQKRRRSPPSRCRPIRSGSRLTR